MDNLGKELIEQFKAGMDPDSAAAVAERVTTAEREIDKLTSAMVDLGYPADGGPVDATAADKAIMALRGVSADRDQLREENEKLGKALEKAKGAATAAKVTAKAAEATPRKLGAIGEDKRLDRAGLRAAIDDAETVEVAFSDGKREVKNVPPVAVSGLAWRDHPNGLLLTEAVTIHGPAQDQAAYTIAGAVLLIDGKPVSYHAFASELVVRAGGTAKIVDDIIF